MIHSHCNRRIRIKFTVTILLCILAGKAFSQDDTLSYLLLFDTTRVSSGPHKAPSQGNSSNSLKPYSVDQSSEGSKGNGETPVVALPSPTAASLGRYGETPVNLYTGRPNIGIPIYELKGNKIGIPITLSYDAGGVRVNDVPGWVGSNWSLSAGGVITRCMKGLPDESTDGYFAKKDWITDLRSISTSQFDDGAAGKWDSEPDEFYFNFDGHSGKIVFDQSLQPKIVPYSKYRVTSTIESGAIKDFTIITDDGTKYTFGKADNSVEKTKVHPVSYYYSILYYNGPLEKTDPNCITDKCEYLDKNKFLYGVYDLIPTGYYRNPSIPEYNSAWYLSEKTDAKGESIKFYYENDGWTSYKAGFFETMTCEKISSINEGRYYLQRDYPEFNVTDKNIVIDQWSSSRPQNPLTPTSTDDSYSFTIQIVEHEQKRLTKIQTDQGHYVLFTADHNRLDLSANKYSFGHELSPQKALTKIEIFDNPNRLLKSFEFNYFYSYPTESSFRELLYYYTSYVSTEAVEREYECKRLFLGSIVEKGFDGLSKPPYVFDYNHPEYLPRRCSNAQDYMGYTNEGLSGYHSRIPILTIENVMYPIVNNISGGFYFGGVLRPDTLLAKAGVLKSIQYPTGGETEYKYELNSIYINNSKVHYKALLPGLRICNIRNLGTSKELINSINYSYLDDSNLPSGYTAVDPLSVLYSKHSYIYSRTEESCHPPMTCSDKYWVNHSGYKITLSSYSLTDSPTTQGNFVGYSKVTETRTGNGRTEYYFYSPKDIADATSSIQKYKTDDDFSEIYPYRITSSYDYKRGMLKSLKVYEEGRSEPIKIVANEYEFNTGLKFYILGAKLSSYLYNGFTDPIIVARTFRLYSNISEWIHPTKTTESIYDKLNNRWIINETNYTYASNDLQLKEVSQTQSDGSTLIKRFRHPSDFSVTSNLASCTENLINCIQTNSNNPGGLAQCYITYGSCLSSVDDNIKNINLLIAKNILTTPIEELVINRKDNVEKLVSGKLTLFHNYGNGFILPISVKGIESKVPILNPLQASFVGGSFIYSSNYKDQLLFDKYDINGNILQYHRINDISASYIYSDNETSPIAEVKNATASDIFFTSYEEDSDFPSLTNKCMTDSHSGKWSCLVTVGGFNKAIDFAKSALHGKYIYSAWVKTSKAGANLTIKDFTNSSSSTYNWITIPNTNSKWQYFEVIANIDDVNYSNSNNIRIELWNNSSSTIYVDDVRFRPINSQMTTYTYDPLIGITSITDNNNRTSYYEYDGLGRLQTTKDEDGNILSHTEYNYINSPTFSVEATSLGHNKFRLNIVGTNFNCSDYTYQWELGDGSMINNSSCTIDYQYPFGDNFNYPVTVKVYKDNNLFKTVNTTCQCVESWFVTSSLDGNCHFAFNLSGALNTIFTYEWDFGDGTIVSNSSLSTISHQYPISFGVSYPVTVKVYSGGDLIKTVTTTVEIVESCILTSRNIHQYDYNFSISGSCYTSTDYTYVWNYGDDTVETNNNYQSSHTYATSGTYRVSVAIKSGDIVIKYLEIIVIPDSGELPI